MYVMSVKTALSIGLAVGGNRRSLDCAENYIKCIRHIVLFHSIRFDVSLWDMETPVLPDKLIAMKLPTIAPQKKPRSGHVVRRSHTEDSMRQPL